MSMPEIGFPKKRKETNMILSELTLEDKMRRRFSEEFKRKKVKELLLHKTRVSVICKEYGVSDASVYKWIHKYGGNGMKKERLIVESESEQSQIISLKNKVALLEQMLGQKQILIEFQQKMIELAEEEYGIDIKKKLETEPSSISEKTGKNTSSR